MVISCFPDILHSDWSGIYTFDQVMFITFEEADDSSHSFYGMVIPSPFNSSRDPGELAEKPGLRLSIWGLRWKGLFSMSKCVFPGFPKVTLEPWIWCRIRTQIHLGGPACYVCIESRSMSLTSTWVNRWELALGMVWQLDLKGSAKTMEHVQVLGFMRLYVAVGTARTGLEHESAGANIKTSMRLGTTGPWSFRGCPGAEANLDVLF